MDSNSTRIFAVFGSVWYFSEQFLLSHSTSPLATNYLPPKLISLFKVLMQASTISHILHAIFRTTLSSKVTAFHTLGIVRRVVANKGFWSKDTCICM